MKSSLILLSLLSVSLCFELTAKTEIFKDFQKFIQKYGKKYKTPSEFMKRFDIFVNNYHSIETINHSNLVDGRTPDYQIGITKFADLTPEEFQTKYLNLDVPQVLKLKEESEVMLPTIEDVPEAFDWRDNNGVSPVKNQGSCGSCWAFSTVGNLEAQYMIKHGGEEKIFSEQQLVDCDTEQDQGCNGGLMEYAFTYLQGAGLMTSEDYPYKGKVQTCQYDAEKATLKAKGYKFAGTEDEEEIKKLLVEQGPLAIAVNATPLQFYFGGIFNPWFSWMCNPKSINHAVLLVGYGVKGKKGYWIIKNSWGKSWGEKGYFRLIRGKGACGVNTYVLSAEIDE